MRVISCFMKCSCQVPCITPKWCMQPRLPAPSSTPTPLPPDTQPYTYRFRSLKHNDRTLFVINKALLSCCTVHATIDNEHRVSVQDVNHIYFVFCRPTLVKGDKAVDFSGRPDVRPSGRPDVRLSPFG